MAFNDIENASPSKREPWIAYLDDEIEEYGEYSTVTDFNKAMKRLLLSKDDTAPADAAREIDGNYSQKFLQSDPLMKFSDDKGMEAYLWALYELIFELGRLIPYNDIKQTKLVQLIVELRKLPPKTFKIWNEECVVYTQEPLFGAVVEECWNAYGPSTTKNVGHGEADSDEYKEACTDWVNFSAFTARCIQAGVFERYDDRGSKYPAWDIIDGLEEDSKDDGIDRDWQVKVSAQYIILAGRRLYEDQISNPASASEWWQKQWQPWRGKFEALSDEYRKEEKTEMAAMTREAHDIMLSLSEAPSARGEYE